ncbi:hypothetical protein SAMN05421858_4296 [Haladaptatus litoreus]|uniref:Uncharacterized protein n=1 Tax=Haladaptatus litoreus TaxID=553468 RepID=A0A1N7EJA3_9EURY|nr:hypothetical protein [Haladaptatus litoreus]SIR88058.1 hypothetical protein SAMN05421858_4296 [Haladaptatus litoreus]
MAHNREPPRTPTTDDHSEWSPDDEITAAEIEETFDQCPHCGTYIVQCDGSHSCIPADYQPHADEPERRRRIEASPFPDDETVLILNQPTSRAYAYHEPNNENKPLCWPHTDGTFDTLSRAEAHDQLQSPCQRCERIRQKREANQ